MNAPAGPSPESARDQQQLLTREALERALAGAGLDRNTIAKVLMASQPSIRLVQKPTTCEEEVSLGASKLGGSPDLPEGMRWPEREGKSMAFLAQIVCRDATEKDRAGLLPKEGRIWFFYDAEGQPWGFDPKHRGGWLVHYDRENGTKLRRTPPPEGLAKEFRFKTCAIEFRDDITLPPEHGQESLHLEGQARDKYVDFEIKANEGVVHRVLGHPNAIQGDMQLECQLVSNGIYCGDKSGYKDPRAAELARDAVSWRLLLQLEEAAVARHIR